MMKETQGVQETQCGARKTAGDLGTFRLRCQRIAASKVGPSTRCSQWSQEALASFWLLLRLTCRRETD